MKPLSFAISSLLAASMAVSDARGQDLFLALSSTAPGFSGIFRVTPAGALTQITFPVGMAQPLLAFEMDQRDGHMIHASRPQTGADIEIYRTVFAGAVPIQQTLMMTIPNTPGLAPYQGDMHRGPDGSFMLLSRGTSGLNVRLDRIGLTRQGGISTQIPIGNPAIFFPQSITEVAVDDIGAIFLTGPGSTPSAGSRIFRLDPTGGFVTTFYTSPLVDFRSVEVRPNGTLLAGGQAFSLATPANLVCGINGMGAGASLFVGAGSGIAGIDDLHIDDTGPAFMALNNFTNPAVQTHNVANCGLGAVVATFPSGTAVLKISRDDPIRRPEFGSSCAVNATTLCRNTELTAPVIGFPWVLGLTGGLPNGGALVSAGNTELPGPVELTPVGAPGCGLFQSNEALSSLITTDAAGAALFVLPVPLTPALIGSSLFAQWSPLTPVNPLGLALSNGIHSIIL